MLKLEEYKKLEENMDEYLNLYCKGIVNKLHTIANYKVNNINYEYELWELERFCTGIDVLYNVKENNNNNFYENLHDYIKNNIPPNTLKIALNVIKENKKNMLNSDIWLLGLSL